MKTAVITDARYRFTVPMIRSLAKAGYRVVACEYTDVPEGEILGFRSSGAAACERIDAQAFSAALDALGEKYGDYALLAVSQRTMALLNRAAHSARAHFLIPSDETLSFCNDTARLLEQIEGAPVRAPRTYAGPEEADVFPCVVKYRSGELLHLKPRERYAIVQNAQELRAVYARFSAVQEDPVVQQYIAGDGYGVGFVANRSHEIVDFICHRRLREYPLAGGPSAYCESIYEAELLRMTQILVEKTRYTGVGMAVFKGGAENGFYLMEINPRFWGSSALVEVAASTLYDSLARLSFGEALQENTKVRYQVGRRMHYFPQNLLALRELAARDGAAKALGVFFEEYFTPGVKDGLFRFSDCAPFFCYLRGLVRRGRQENTQ